MEIDDNQPAITYKNQIPALTHIESEDEPIDVDEPFTIQAPPKLPTIEAAPELHASEAPHKLCTLDAPPELHALEAPQELLGIEAVPKEQELCPLKFFDEFMALEAPQELQELEASLQLYTLKAPPLEPEPIMTDQVDNSLLQLPPLSI